MKWPTLPGRYKLGNLDSPVAVTTMASIEMDLPMDDIAIMGKTVTENIGVERIVKNIISNPKIRFLVCCGKVSKGHFVGDALKCLAENGVDEKKRIIGAKGSMPVVKNLSLEEIKRFSRQVEVVCMQGEEDVEKISGKVKECIERNPGPFKEGMKLKSSDKGEKVKAIKAWHKEDEVELEPVYFKIGLDRRKKVMIAECYDLSHALKCMIEGKNAEEMTHTIIREGLIKNLAHAAYLGRELQKAEIALKNDLEFVDQEELKIK